MGVSPKQHETPQAGVLSFTRYMLEELEETETYVICNRCDPFNIFLHHYMPVCSKTWVSPFAFCEDSGISTEDFVAQLGRAGELSIVSRLDYPTSGLLPLAVGVESPADHWLRAQFAGRLVWKEYVCLCEGATLGEVGTQGVDLDEHIFCLSWGDWLLAMGWAWHF